MIENINEKENEIKEIYFKHRNEMTAMDIFKNYLGEHFDVAMGGGNRRNKDWTVWMGMMRKWRAEENKSDTDEKVNEISDEDADMMQEKNIRRSIVILNNALNRLEKNPKALKKIDVFEIRRLMTTIEGIKQARERTVLQGKKLNLEAVKTFLPYQRMSIEDLNKLQEEITYAIDEFKQLQSPEIKTVEFGESGDTGQVPAGTG